MPIQSPPGQSIYTLLPPAERADALHLNISIAVPLADIDSKISFIVVVGAPEYSFAPDHGMLIWHLICMLQTGDYVQIKFYAPDQPSEPSGTVRLEYQNGPYNPIDVCSFPLRCGPQVTVRHIIQLIIRNRMSRYACGTNARHYIWWCSMMLYQLAKTGFVEDRAAMDFRKYVEEVRSTQEDMRSRIPEIIEEGWPITTPISSTQH